VLSAILIPEHIDDNNRAHGYFIALDTLWY